MILDSDANMRHIERGSGEEQPDPPPLTTIDPRQKDPSNGFAQTSIADRTKVIGFTYGTFDLLHDGHRHLLRRARRRCDQLIVAIDSDRFAGELKGPGRPVESAAIRSQNLVATGLVNLVVEVDEPRPPVRRRRLLPARRVFFGNDGRVANSETTASS